MVLPPPRVDRTGHPWQHRRHIAPDQPGLHRGRSRHLGQDENGDTGSGQVVLYLPAGSSRSISASELEDGASGLTGRLGDGEGDWRLLIFADSGLEIEAMTLLDQTSRALANLSTARAGDGEILLFPSTADPSLRGELRLASRSGSGEVRISAIDEAGQVFGPVYLELDGEHTVSLDSYDLEFGNAAKGLTTGFGQWRGRLASLRAKLSRS